MRRRPLGRTGETVSVVSLGASPLGNVFREVSLGEAVAVLEAARDLGIDLIDVAPYYGAGEAEAKLGRALAALGETSFKLATKVGRYGQEATDCDYSSARTRLSVEESLTRLGLERIDLIQVHDVEFGDLEQIRAETLPELERLRTEGKVRWIGITGLSLNALDNLADAPQLDTILSYCRLTLSDRALESHLTTYQRAGLGVINAAPLAMGLLSSRGTPTWHPAPEELRRRSNLAAEHCRRRGATIEDLAIQFALSCKGVATTVCGTANADHLRRTAALATEPPDPALLCEIETILAPVRDLSWPTGRAENK